MPSWVCCLVSFCCGFVDVYQVCFIVSELDRGLKEPEIKAIAKQMFEVGKELGCVKGSLSYKVIY
jgi:hypothetical protein